MGIDRLINAFKQLNQTSETKSAITSISKSSVVISSFLEKAPSFAP